MDPITAVLVAAGAAVAEKAKGAAVKYLQDAVEERARRLWGVISEPNKEKFARLMVEHVLAEAAQYPPEKALLVVPLASVGIVGIWGPKGTLKLNLLWINRADFPVHVRDLRVTGKAGGRQPEWDSLLGEEFVLGPRKDTQRLVVLEPQLELPSFERGGANCDLSITALVCGPWEDGRAQRTQDLIPNLGVYMPVVGIEPSGIMTHDADVDVMIDDYLQGLVSKGDETVRVHYTDLDRTLRLRVGACKERLQVIAGKRGHKVDAAPSVARVTFHREPEPTYSYGGSVSLGGSARSAFGDPDEY